jgi:hypothetical protein
MVEEDDKLDIGLQTVAEIFSAGKINDNEHDKLKEMLFAEDGVLFSLMDTYPAGSSDLEEAIIKYAKGANHEEDTDINTMSSPLDGGLDFAKRKRMN